MAGPVASLIQQSRAITAQQDVILLAFAREMVVVLRAMDRRLGELVDDVARGVTSARVRAAQLAALRREIRAALTAAGYEAMVARVVLSPAVTQLVDLVLRQATGRAAAAFVTGSVSLRLRAAQALLESDWLQVGDDLSRQVWRTTVRSVFAQSPRLRIIREVQRTLDQSGRQARTSVDTAVAVYSRQVSAIASEDADAPAFVYLGPADGKVRPFCAQHLGKVYTRAAINRLDNGQLPNVFLTGGGYNCRHQFVEISRFSELRELLGTGKRAPEVEALFQGVRRAA
jgi:hypothetical protein